MNNTEENWLLTEFPKFKGLVPKGNVWDAYLNAERILLGRDKIMERGCNCQRGSVKSQVDAMYEDWLRKYAESKKV